MGSTGGADRVKRTCCNRILGSVLAEGFKMTEEKCGTGSSTRLFCGQRTVCEALSVPDNAGIVFVDLFQDMMSRWF